MSTVADLTERDLIARIHARLAPAPDWLVVGIGDDAAVVEPERNRLAVLTTDALIDGVHFDQRFTPPDAIGHRALAANLSDLAAMGATPRMALLSFALPAALEVGALERIVDGLASLAVRHKLHIVGGNLTRTPGPLAIDITAIGSAKRRRVLTRNGARPGDDVYVSGTVGTAAAGLQILKTSAATAGGGDASVELCVQRYLRPEPRLRLGQLLARNQAASACMDLSDGLADAVSQVAEASGVGMTIDADALPIEPQARQTFGGGFEALITGGDDYELLFTARPRQRGRIRHVIRHSDVAITRIGICTAAPRVILRHAVNAEVTDTPMPRGYQHFAQQSLVPNP